MRADRNHPWIRTLLRDGRRRTETVRGFLPHASFSVWARGGHRTSVGGQKASVNMSDQKNGKRTKVNIFGTEYRIRGTEEAEYIRKAAMYVDAKMREVAVSSSLSTTQVAVLAALNIVDELFKEQAKKDTGIEIDEADGMRPEADEDRPRVARLTALLRNKIAEAERMLDC